VRVRGPRGGVAFESRDLDAVEQFIIRKEG
jgi:hypothetical protein